MTNKRPAVCDDAFRRDWRSLVAMTRKGTALRVLLRHSFFAPLQVRGASMMCAQMASADARNDRRALSKWVQVRTRAIAIRQMAT